MSSFDRVKLDPPILSAPFIGIVGRDEIRLAGAAWNQPGLRYALPFQIFCDCFGATLRKLEIVVFAPNRIAVAGNIDSHIRMSFENFGRLIKNRRVAWPNLRLVEVKMHPPQHELFTTN